MNGTTRRIMNTATTNVNGTVNGHHHQYHQITRTILYHRIIVYQVQAHSRNNSHRITACRIQPRAFLLRHRLVNINRVIGHIRLATYYRSRMLSNRVFLLSCTASATDCWAWASTEMATQPRITQPPASQAELEPVIPHRIVLNSQPTITSKEETIVLHN